MTQKLRWMGHQWTLGSCSTQLFSLFSKKNAHFFLLTILSDITRNAIQRNIRRNCLFTKICAEWIFSLIAINLSKIRSYCDEWDNSVRLEQMINTLKCIGKIDQVHILKKKYQYRYRILFEKYLWIHWSQVLINTLKCIGKIDQVHILEKKYQYRYRILFEKYLYTGHMCLI